MHDSRKDVLNGWKEIAAYIDRDVRTVERWEKQRGLPVRRVPGGGKAGVYAHVAELEAWLKNPSNEAPSATVKLADVEPALAEVPAPEASPPRRRWPLVAAVVLAVAGGVAAYRVFRPSHSAAASAVPASVGGAAIPYSSGMKTVDDLYLRGIYFSEQRTPTALHHALDAFSQAAKLNPRYAPAFSGQARCWILLREYASVPDTVGYPSADKAAHQALSLDPNLADAHVALGFLDFFYHLDGAAAETQFQEALREAPSLALAHHWYGSVLIHQGRFAEALAHLDEAQRLEPASKSVLVTRALALGLEGHRPEATALLADLMQSTEDSEDRSFSTAHRVLAFVSLAPPRNTEAYLTETIKEMQLRQNAADVALYRQARAEMEKNGDRAMWTFLLEHARKQDPSSLLVADYSAALGDKETALRLIEEHARAHDFTLSSYWIHPLYADLRSDPRFQAALRSLRP